MSTSLSDVQFDMLVVKLVTVLEIAQRPEGTTTPAAKQDLRHALSEFREMLNKAREVASGLPGGDMVVEDQEQIIEMLENIRNDKRNQLARFSEQSIQSTMSTSEDMVAEIDSNASTPAA